MFVVVLSLMMNQGYWKLQSTCDVNLRKEWSLFRVLSAMIIEEFELPLYIKFTTLWPSWSGTSHGMIQLYNFRTGIANNKNFIFIKHKSVKSWNFRKKKKRPYNLFEQIVFSDLQMLVCFHGDTIFFFVASSLYG